jgi:hypothetical protein
MALLQKSDLLFDYSWTAIPPDDPKATGIPDNTLLNRNEGYEVLAFINKFATKHKFANKSSGLKVERLIKEHLPGTTRSHANVTKWLEDNWAKH